MRNFGLMFFKFYISMIKITRGIHFATLNGKLQLGSSGRE